MLLRIVIDGGVTVQVISDNDVPEGIEVYEVGCSPDERFGENADEMAVIIDRDFVLKVEDHSNW